MGVEEQSLWPQMGTTVPVQVLSLDDVPLTSLYVEPPEEPHGGR